jgi:hypothetical protein
MARIVRFIEEGSPNVVRLELESTSSAGFKVGRGFDLGAAGVDATWLLTTAR